jgi:hypothetical protein
MTITVSVTEDVTTLSVTDTETTLTIVPSTIELGVVNVAFSQASSADTISSEATGHITATTVQDALAEIGADPQFTSTLKTKLDDIEEEANKLTAGTNVNISEGAINADVLGAISAGQNISISDTGEISASAVSLTDVYTADSETAHLDLDPTPNQGDVVIRTDENKTYIHNGGTTGTMADYTELATTGGVNSINGATGVVSFGKANLSDYQANEFIDWTVEQATNIHANNIDATTYYAGLNIVINEVDGLQYISTPASARINVNSDTLNIASFLQDNNATIEYSLEVDHDYLLQQDNSGLNFESPHTTGLSPRPKKIFIEGINQDFFATGGGLVVYSKDIQSDETVPIMLLSESTFQLSPDVTLVRLSETVAVGSKTLCTTSESGVRKVKLHNDVWTETAEVGTSDTGLATTQFVANALALSGGGGANIPDGSGHEKFVTQDEDGVFRNRDLNIENIYYQAGDNVRQKIFNQQIDIDAGNYTTIYAGQGITLTANNDDLTISANPDGLPTQSSSTDGYVLTSDGANADWVDLSIASLPVQTDNSGKFLTTNGTNASWAEVDVLPSRVGADNKFLTVFNNVLSWADVDALPEQSADTNGKFLSSNGVAGGEPTWALPDSTIPTQDTHTGKFLTTDGSQLSWATINTAGQTGDISFSQSTITSSGDTVTVDDDLTTTGTLDAQQLDITGAGQPQLTSTSTFNIVAPEGVFVNGSVLEGSQVQNGFLGGNIVTLSATQNDNSLISGVAITGITCTFYDNSDGIYIEIGFTTAWTKTKNVFIDVKWNEDQDAAKAYEQRTDIRIVKHEGGNSPKWRVYFYNGAGQEGTDTYKPVGKFKLDIYEA